MLARQDQARAHDSCGRLLKSN